MMMCDGCREFGPVTECNVMWGDAVGFTTKLCADCIESAQLLGVFGFDTTPATSSPAD